MVQNRFQNGFKNWFVYPKLMSKSIPNGGVWGLILGGRVVILGQFWRYGGALAPKCVLEGVLEGFWMILRAKMGQLEAQDGSKLGPE